MLALAGVAMLVTEIFHSIQGESSYAGRSCVFVRLTGCPLRCNWCDTAYSFYGGTQMTVEEVLNRVGQYGCPLVEVTGGEPLHQPESLPLVEALCSQGYEVLIETSGAVDVSSVDRRARLIMDVKCPGSGMADRMHWDNLRHLQPTDELKFVIKDRSDYDWAVTVLKQYDLASRAVVLFSPVFGALDPRQLAEWILADRLLVRFQLQLHKYVWAPDMRGV
jgi:7-carboxy-7-deazaguanine synthase